MLDEIRSRAAAPHEAEVRARLKSQFKLFFQPLQTEADLFAMSGDNDEVVASIACGIFEHGSAVAAGWHAIERRPSKMQRPEC